MLTSTLPNLLIPARMAPEIDLPDPLENIHHPSHAAHKLAHTHLAQLFGRARRGAGLLGRAGRGEAREDVFAQRFEQEGGDLFGEDRGGGDGSCACGVGGRER